MRNRPARNPGGKGNEPRWGRRTRLLRLEPLSLQAWRAAVAPIRPLPFFYLPEAYQAQEVLHPTYQSRALRVETPEGAYLFPLLESRRGGFRWLYSGPDGVYGGLLPLAGAPPASRALYQALLDRLLGLRTPCAYLTLPALSPLGLAPLGRAEDQTFRLRPGAGFEHFFHQILPSKRRNIYRRGLRAGLEARWGAEHLAGFLALYRQKQWVRVYPEAYWRALLATGRAHLWVALRQGEPLAALWLLEGQEELFYFLGVQAPEAARLSPLTFLLVEALRHHMARGAVQVLDLGTSMGMEGVEHFKRSFGAEPVPVEHRTWCRLPLVDRLRRLWPR